MMTPPPRAGPNPDGEACKGGHKAKPRAVDTSEGAAERTGPALDTAADAYLTATAEQQIRSSFNFARQSAVAGIARRLTRDLSVSGSYQIQRVRLFDENISQGDQLDIDRLFPQVRLSSFSTSLIRDTRDLTDATAGKLKKVVDDYAKTYA